MDVLEIDAASNTGVDKVRDVIIEKVNYAPAEGRYRVYIIDEVHQLSSHAFNALLKTLEEPPPHVVFILATTETHKVPGTILSRCQRFDFKPISARDIINRLKVVCDKEHLDVEATGLARIARASEGSARDALSILEQASAYSDGTTTEVEIEAVLGSVSQELLFQMTEAVLQKDSARAVMLIHESVNKGKDIQQFFLDFGAYLRDLLLLGLGCTVDELTIIPDEVLERMKLQAQRMGRAGTAQAIETVCHVEREMRTNSQHRLLAELTLFKLTQEPEAAQPSATPPPTARETVETPASPKAPLLSKARPSQASRASHAEPEAEVAVSAEESEAPASAGDGDLQGLWSQVLNRARKQAVSLAAILLDAQLVAVEANTATLEFANQFHHDNIAESGQKKQVVAGILTEVLGRPVEVRCTLKGGRGSREGGRKAERTVPPETETQSGTSLPPPDEPADLVQTAISLFDATIVSEKVKE